MSLLNSLAKLYVRYTFREEGAFDALKTQREFNEPQPPKRIADRCEPLDLAPGGFWIDRENESAGTLVYLHGGAFYFGPVKEHWQYIAGIAKRAGMAAIIVDYGLAPQSPFPKPLEEVVGLMRSLELDGNKWFFIGDSSGAALVVAATLRLKEENGPQPNGLVLLSPWVDATLENPDIELTVKDDVMMTVERLAAAAAIYAGDHPLSDPMISPMFADVSGLPRTLIQMGTADLLLADCRKFVQKCRDAGVDVKYDETPGAFHDFMMLGFLPEARRALASQAAFLHS
jgi:acetyl esterase/lipase